VNNDTKLSTLKENFLAGSTQSMPIAGMIYWAAVGIAAFLVPPKVLAIGVACGSGAIFPLGVLIDRLRGRNLLKTGRDNPLTQMFMQSIFMITLLWPLVILGGLDKPNFIVLGTAILTGIVWIPYGWAANDPVGLRHAVVRGVLCYAAYIWAPAEFAASTIAASVLVCYAYSIIAMRRSSPTAPTSTAL
jgi:hypothetical protein